MLREQTAADDRRRSRQAKKFTGKLDILIGTMIEIPRAALTADEIAEHAEFFSFGTNDLTQMTFGFSRDDINTFLPDYLEQELLPQRPVPVARHRRASASWSRWACRRAARRSKDLKFGICGEHGGDPASSSSATRSAWTTSAARPFRVPIARLAAAQAALAAAK